MISSFLIQQEGVEREMSSLAVRRRGGGGGGTILAGLRLSIVGIYLVEKLGNRELARGLVSLGPLFL